MKAIRNAALAVTASLTLAACAGSGPDMKTVDYVDLERFMGDWYVIANIPTFLEKGAHNAVERYEMNDDGTIATTFTFRDGSFDGKEKEYNPKGFIRDTESNALWGMRFIWPIKAEARFRLDHGARAEHLRGRLRDAARRRRVPRLRRLQGRARSAAVVRGGA
jgi:apolipoprotein D and lipocalin family protein